MQNSEFVVEAVGLSKVYKDFWGRQKAIGVDGINFKVKKGQVLGLLGPNGSGKTTTIKLILGLLTPGSGSLKVLNKNPNNVLIKRRIGYLPEDTYLYKFLRADETLEFFGSFFTLSSSERKKRTHQLLEMVGLSHAAKRHVGEFSKGMMRRIGLAQALINDPDLVILDEPTSGLDPIGCRDVKTIVRLLARRNKKIIICSHLLSDMEEICDNVLIMHRGRILAEGPLKKLLTDQDKTQITTPKLDKKSLQKLVTALEKNLPSENITVNHPKITLEKLFLDVLNRDAKTVNDSSLRTGPSTKIPQYLTKEMENSKTSEEILQQIHKEPKKPCNEKESHAPINDQKIDLSPNLSLLEDLNTKTR